MRISADIHVEGVPVFRFNSGETACWIEIRDSMDKFGSHAAIFAQNVAPGVLERAVAAFNEVIAQGKIKQAAE